MKLTVKFLMIAAVATSLFSASLFAENEEIKECRLRVNGVGDFAIFSLSSRMIGTAYLDNKQFPDLFMLGEDRYYGNNCHRYAYIGHDAEGTPVFEKKETVTMPVESIGNGIIIQDKMQTFLVWTNKGKIKYAKYDAARSSFDSRIYAVEWPSTAYNPKKIAVELLPSGATRVTYSTTTMEGSRGGDWRSADYFPFDGAGRWRGTIQFDGICSFEYPGFFSGIPSKPSLVTKNEHEFLGGIVTIVPVSYDGGAEGYIAGTRFGGVYFLKRQADGRLADKIHITDSKSNVLRNPTINAGPVLYPNRNGKTVDIITTGEGGAFFFRHETFSEGGQRFTEAGQRISEAIRPIYEEPVSLKEKNPFLYVGSLSTPTLVDWDGDGLLDLVLGNSAGYITFFKNTGTNLDPSFGNAEYLKANGETIHIQPGYGEDVQGPGESRWGYVGANVFDWNGDGHYDILTNDSRGRHTVFMWNPEENRLDAGKSMLVNDLELHGTWRCRPGVGILDGKYVYITLDDDDEAHLYFREDNRHLIDGGKLRLTDGKPIIANWLEAGGKGRLRFEIVDWDGDGIKDIVLATNKHHSIPEPTGGMPWHQPEEQQGATLLFLKNAGTEADPVFEYPRQLKYKGVPVRFGHHACGASAGMMGEITGGLPNLVVADEKGSLFLLPRKHLSW